jgi:hypothetical protein
VLPRRAFIAGGAAAFVAQTTSATTRATLRSVAAATSSGETIGGGTKQTAAVGPAPAAPKFDVGTGWVLVKNWHFGTSGTIRSNADLDLEFQYRDEFNSYSGAGFKYGSLTVATSDATATRGQPIEDPSRPVRNFTPTEMFCTLQASNPSATMVSSSAHDCHNGSIYSKFTLPKAGSLLGEDILWEFMVRLFPVQAYWAGCWVEGQAWDGGAEIDVHESFGWDHGIAGNNFDAHSFHTDACWKNTGTGSNSATSQVWMKYPNSVGSNYHRYDFLYRKDNTWQVWVDDVPINRGTQQWTLTGATGATPLTMYFQHDFAWGFNDNLGTVNGVANQGMSPSNFAVSNFAGKSYGIQYSRIYLR